MAVQDTITIPNDLSEIAPIQERIQDLMEDCNFGLRDVFGVKLALEEALVNAMKHGNKTVLTKSVVISYSVDEGRATITIEDEGEGFHPEDVPDPTLPENLKKPCGRGLLMMRRFMSSVEYNDKGNVVTMTKIPEPRVSKPGANLHIAEETKIA